MASKKAKTTLHTHLHIKKPVKDAKKALKEAARIKHNEQNKLYRMRQKFATTKKKGEADKLRKAIRTQERANSGISAAAKEIKGHARQMDTLKQEISSLRKSNAHKAKILQGKVRRRVWDDEAKTTQNQRIKNESLIQAKMDQLAALTYKINKTLGYDPKTIVDNIDIRDKVLDKEFHDDFSSGFWDGKAEEKKKEEQEAKEAAEEATEELSEETGEEWVIDLRAVFWDVWDDFKNNETQKLADYDQVIFMYSGQEYSYAGASAAMILNRAGQMWAYAQELGSDTIVVKEVTTSRPDKLRYTVEE